jgi:5-methylcytosine-specific restriction protein A
VRKVQMLGPRLGGPGAKPWRRTHSVERRAGSWLQAQRAELFRSEPWCRMCATRGKLSLASIRDHIIPLAEGGTDEPGNIQPLCVPCHDAKTLAEAARGRGGP